ncbi:MAG: hypothetical protein WAU11_15935 [Ignavibacteriaceae bacterium]
MKKLALFLVLQFIIFSVSEIPAQTNTREGPTVISFLPQGYGIKLLNSSGTSSILNDVSNLGFMNPASISEFENYSLGFSYQINTSTDEAWIADFGTSRVYNFYPQSVGGIIKWNDFTFGLGFGQKYNGTLDTDPVEVRSIEYPNGTGEFFEMKQETMIHSYSITASYSFKDLLPASNDITIGFRYSLNYLDRYDEIWHITGSATDYSSNIAAGLNYKISFDDQQHLMIGVSYESKTYFDAKYEVDNSVLILYDPEDTTNTYIPVEQSDSYLLHTLPDELRIDLAFDAASDLKLLANLTSVFWANETNSLKDQIDYSFSAIYQINEMFTPSLGFYITDCEYTDNFYSRLNEGLNSFFITAGLRFNYNNSFTDLAIADSHLFSGDYRKQTIAKLAIGVQL